MELIVISDLHLSAGYSEKTKKYSRIEDFFFDEQFKRFLEFFQNRNSRYKKYYHLIIAGDMFDFLQVDGLQTEELYRNGGAPFRITERERKFGFGTEADKTVWKLGLIAKGHKVFFQSLANFLSKGNHLSIITGNHDIELYWAKVRNALKDRIVESKRNTKTRQQIKSRIKFYPWFYYDKDYETYIEHGNQYDTFNSFQYLLCPVFVPKRKITAFGAKRPLLGGKSKKLWLPFGSLFVRYFFNKLEAIHPFADNIKPATKYIRWAWNEDKFQFLKNWIYIPTMIRVYLKNGNLSGTNKRLLNNHNERKLKRLAQEFDLPMDTATRIHSLKALPFTSHKFLNILTFSNFFFIVSAAIVFGVLFLLTRFGVFSFWNTLYSIVLLILPIARWLSKFLPRDPINKKLVTILGNVFKWMAKHLKDPISKWLSEFFQRKPFEKAFQIRVYLENSGIDVRTIVFGHTHDPDIRYDERDAGIGDNNFRYFNTGTWTTVFSEEERIVREEKQFALVWIKKKDGKLDPGLYRWNDCLKKPEKLIIFEPKHPEISLIIRIPRAIYNFFAGLFPRSYANEKKEAETADKQKEK